MRRNWKIQTTLQEDVASLSQALGVSSSIAHLLLLRGIKTYDQAKAFFRPDISQLHSPWLMKDMQKAIERLEQAIQCNEKILVYGDYDVDGTTSVAMMFTFLNQFTKNIDYYIPCRHKEGYGISTIGIDFAKENNCSLIIALDCGITAIKQIEYANLKGIDFIICDHHQPEKIIPNAVAILNPKQIDCTYPFKELTGGGVGFKLMQAIGEKKGISIENLTHYLDYLVVSIAADLVPIVGENRVFAFLGLQQLNKDTKIGLEALKIASKRATNFTISDIVFGIAPRINAAGRLDHGKLAVELLIEKDPKKAQILSEKIEEINSERRKLDQEITEEALKMIDSNKKSTVVFHEGWHKGVVGIVASRLIEKHYRPTIVLTEENGMLTGSARSVSDFDLYAAIDSCRNYLEKFGGHKFAAGLSLKKQNIKDFADAFEKTVASSITPDQLIPTIEIDLTLELTAIDEKFYRIIQQFAPFGPGNRTPVFVSKNVYDNGMGSLIGTEQTHLRLNISDPSTRNTFGAIGFSMAHFWEQVRDKQKFDVCYSIDENIWNGKSTIQLKIKDIQ